MKTKKIYYLSVLTLSIAFVSCKKDTPKPASSVKAAEYTNGVFITNEGAFSNGTGTVSFFSKDSLKVSNDIYQLKNGVTLGSVVQSIELFNGKGYIVVNNSGKVVTVNSNTFLTEGEITGFTQPRYFLGINTNKGYVSEYGASGTTGAVKVLDLTTKAITKTISTGKGANRMVKSGNYVYVACNGGFDTDSVILIIDVTSDTVLKIITVGTNPSDVQVDINGNVWVLCVGKMKPSWTAFEKPASLVKINAVSNMVDFSIVFDSTLTNNQPSNLVINSTKNKLFYVYGSGVYSHEITSSTLNSTATINRSFYGLGIDPTNDYFYGADAGDFQSNGKVIRYNASAAVIDSFAVGIIPGNFYFK